MKFAEKGRSVEGVDCWGLVKLVYENERGIDVPSYVDDYETTNDRQKISDIISSESAEKWEMVKEPREYDVVILDMRGIPMHVGIVTKPGHMIHCARGINTVHENFTTARWRHKIKGFARWKA